MARIDSKVLFMITSPRTPERMIPEIDLLQKNFSGQNWNTDTQKAFMEVLRSEDFFFGVGEKDPAFSARDRINRAPKALGFVQLSPSISLTDAGEKLINSRYTNEVFLRQLLKFQIPSPFHKPSENAAKFWVKPYLEIFRLIRHFGSLKFDELWLFGMQLVDYNDFDLIVHKIEDFRIAKAINPHNYKKFREEYLHSELRQIYAEEIDRGETNTRESADNSLSNFLRIKGRNMRDYADACLRYIRATGIVTISKGRSLSISKEYLEDVDYFLNNIDRNPCFIDDEYHYTELLYDSLEPKLLTDNKDLLVQKIKAEFGVDVNTKADTLELKELFIDKTAQRREDIISRQVSEIKNYMFYDDIQQSYNTLFDSYDPSLLLEWNTWRAMTMLDGGNIKGNLKFDDTGNPLSTAQGNMADIVCDYGSFDLIVEVTMASGAKQFEMEGEPIMRHLGKHRRNVGKQTYCFFIAPRINENCIAYIWTLYRAPLPIYGGTCAILPLSLDVFQKMVDDSYKASYIPNPSHVEALCKKAEKLALESVDSNVWFTKLTDAALNWLHASE